VTAMAIWAMRVRDGEVGMGASVGLVGWSGSRLVGLTLVHD